MVLYLRIGFGFVYGLIEETSDQENRAANINGSAAPKTSCKQARHSQPNKMESVQLALVWRALCVWGVLGREAENSQHRESNGQTMSNAETTIAEVL